MHAADDLSVMQTIEALPHVFSSAKAHAGGRPYRIGPSGIGMRINPAGSTTAANPQAIRLAMATADPRQDGLFGAAWTLGYAAEAAKAGVNEIALADAGGPFGIVGEDGGLRPLFHVLRGLARLSGAPIAKRFRRAARDCRIRCRSRRRIGAVAGEPDAGRDCRHDRRIVAGSLARPRRLDAARREPAFLDRLRPARTRCRLAPTPLRGLSSSVLSDLDSRMSSFASGLHLLSQVENAGISGSDDKLDFLCAGFHYNFL